MIINRLSTKYLFISNVDSIFSCQWPEENEGSSNFLLELRHSSLASEHYNLRACPAAPSPNFSGFALELKFSRLHTSSTDFKLKALEPHIYMVQLT